MAQHWSEGVGTLRFTSREYQQELIDIGCKDNLLACPPEQAANFVALKILQEMAHQIRLPNKMKSVFITKPRKVKSLETELRHLTDLHVASLGCDNDGEHSPTERKSVIDDNQVLVVVSSVFDDVLVSQELDLSSVNLMVIDECHSIVSDKHLQNIMATYYRIKDRELNTNNTIPRIIAFSYPLFNHSFSFDHNNLDNTFNKIQKDYDDFINNRSEFYNQWDCDDLESEPPTKSMDRSNSSTPIKLSSTNSSVKNSPIRRQECDQKLEKQTYLNLEKNCEKVYDSLSYFVESAVVDEDENYKKMTDFNYWRMDHLILDIPEMKKKPERLSIYDKLEFQLEKLEGMLFCKADMAPDIVGLKKITGKPREVLLQCSDASDDSYLCKKGKILKHYMKRTVFNALVFLDDHRYDPLEIYGDDAFGDELRAIPNPVVEPRDLLYQFLHILDQAGPYAADKAAFILLLKIEKLKVKIPYERHFLLFCLVTSVLVQIRSAAEIVFEKYQTETEKINKFTSTKVLRLMDIFKLFKPKVPPSESANNETQSNQMDTKTQSSNQECDIKKDSNNSEGEENKTLNSKVDDNFTSNVVLDDDTIKVYVKDTSDIINSSQQPNDLIQQIDSCDFQSLQSKLEQQCKETKYSNGTQTNQSSCDSVIIEATSIVDELISSADILVKATVEQSNPEEENTIGKIENNTMLDDMSESKTENRNTVDDVCYTKGAFETLCQSNPIVKEKEGTSYNGVDKRRNHENNSIIENQSIVTEENPNLNSHSDLNYKTTPKRKYNDVGKKTRKGEYRSHNWNDPDSLCGLIFVDEPLMAKILYSLIYEYSRHDPELQFINAQFTVDKTADPQTEPKEAENEHKLQEEVLRRFRTHECNLLIGTSVLEDGMDLPKCNLVIRWDAPRGYRCYAQCRSRARAPRSMYALMAPEQPKKLVTALAHYTHIEKMLVRKCRWSEPGPMEEVKASEFTLLIHPYRPHQQAVTLSQAVQLVNRYCAKLPSDTFTRLVPLWSTEEINYKGHVLYICSVRLPINSPLKHQIVGHPMPTKVLARRIAALQLCRALHLSGELDDNLLPIGKESFRALEPEWMNMMPASDNIYLNTENHNEPRPGTTKRKQYYYKKIAKSLTGCRPTLGNPCLAYEIRANLAVPLPERHNTRGRKLHPPENYAQGFCILTNKPMHQIPVFPLFTRSGEVRIELVKMPVKIVMNRKRSRLIHRFMKYTFKEVLRVHNHLMLFNPGKGKKNNYYIVPTTKVTNADGNTNVVVDWEFLELIYEHTEAIKNVIITENNQKTIKTKEEDEENTNNENQPSNDAVSSEVEKDNVEPTLQNNVNVDSNQSDEENKINAAVDKNTNENNENVNVAKTVESDEKKDCNIDEEKSSSEICRDESDDKKLIKLEDLGEDLLEDTWKGQENKISSVKWDELEENECNIKNTKKSEDDLPVEEEPEEMPNPYLAPGEVFQFEHDKYRDAVVTPWYRNQNQPQYFYVAEICRHLTPLSAFPSSVHPSFMHYYNTKYGVTITQIKQPLLDVDHTSARLNLLTPRFVNRKGVALPTSSERTKRAKRELLEQKQILVPELCCTHPFRGALWRAAVTLPCVLYRINSLLLADEIRRSVAVRVSLGEACPSPNFSWPPLDFGWSLADVLKEKTDSNNQKDSGTDEELNESAIDSSSIIEDKQTVEVEDEENENKVNSDDPNEKTDEDGEREKEKTANEIIIEKEKSNGGDVFEVGTWSNEMASTMSPVGDEDDIFSKLPGNITMCPNSTDNDWNASYPNKYDNVFSQSHHRKYSVADSDISYTSSDMDVSGEETNSDDDEVEDAGQKENEKGGIRIEFKSGNEAEAIDIPSSTEELEPENQDDLEARRLEEQQSLETFNQFFYVEDESEDKNIKKYINDYEREIKANEEDIMKNGTVIKYGEPLSNIKLIDYSENIPFHTPKHNGYRHINKRIDYLVHSLRNSASKHLENIQQVSSKEIDRTSKKIVESEINPIKMKEDLTNPFPDIYEKAMSKDEIRNLFQDMFPYEKRPLDKDFESDCEGYNLMKGGAIDLEDLENNKRRILNEIKSSMPKKEWRKYNFFAMKDFHNDDTFEADHEDILKKRIEQTIDQKDIDSNNISEEATCSDQSFSFDYQPDLKTHPGPSPSIILQALTMSNANDGINLERLETVGDSFLKYAITIYLYCTYPNIHEGKLSYLRSKQVSNLNLYRLGRRRHLGGRMVACKFEPHDNWLPPCHKVPAHLERALIHTHIPSSLWNVADMPSLDKMTREEVEKLVYERVMQQHLKPASNSGDDSIIESQVPNGSKLERSTCSIHENTNFTSNTSTFESSCHEVKEANNSFNTTNDGDNILQEVPCFVPYNLITQHSIPDKSIADCVEALIGAYLIECGPRGALLFMAWLGVRVLPKQEIVLDHTHPFIKLMEEAQIRKKAQSEESKRNRENRKENKLSKKTAKKTLKKINQANELNEDVCDTMEPKNNEREVECVEHKENISSNDVGKKKSKKKHKTNHPIKESKEADENKPKNPLVEEKCQKDINETESLVKINKRNKARKRKGKQKSKTEKDDENVVPKNENDNMEIKPDNQTTITEKSESIVKAADNISGFDVDECDDESYVNWSENSLESSDEEDEEDSINSCGDESDWSEIDSDVEDIWCQEKREPGSLLPYKNKDGQWVQIIFGQLEPPPSPLLRYVPDPDGELMQMLSGYDELERTLKYRFKDRCYLLQAMTHASHTHNRLTDCYQRLEFLGDAVLDYLITRQLYEDPRRHSPGPLTDLRSALVNNTIFASLAVRHGMHKFFRHLSPGLNEVLARFVKIQEENGHSISEEHYLIQEDECEQAEDVEVPKALGDLFESVAGAIFLDSGMSLDAVWKVYYALMHKEMELFSETVPKSPVRELLEMEPETTKFGKPEKLADGRRVRVTVEVLGVGAFKGVGRNFRIAKCTAAKCALRHLNLLRGKTGGVKSKK